MSPAGPGLILATRNRGKARELSQLLRQGSLTQEVVSLADMPDVPEVEETADSFEGNAAKKASEVASFLARPCLADDSGLVVDALGGRPGVFSARFSGPHATDSSNVELLLRLLADVPDPLRTARFRCVVAVAVPAAEPSAPPILTLFQGSCEGTIGWRPAGESGFGYDPVFLPAGKGGATFAQLSDGEKNEISHRGRALRLALPFIRALLAGGLA